MVRSSVVSLAAHALLPYCNLPLPLRWTLLLLLLDVCVGAPALLPAPVQALVCVSRGKETPAHTFVRVLQSVRAVAEPWWPRRPGSKRTNIFFGPGMLRWAFW